MVRLVPSPFKASGSMDPLGCSSIQVEVSQPMRPELPRLFPHLFDCRGSLWAPMPEGGFMGHTWHCERLADTCFQPTWSILPDSWQGHRGA